MHAGTCPGGTDLCVRSLQLLERPIERREGGKQVLMNAVMLELRCKYSSVVEARGS
jgi:hypothetical protein